MGSYAMNYNWHKKFAKSSKVNYNELYLLGLAEKNKRKKELEEQRKVSFFSYLLSRQSTVNCDFQAEINDFSWLDEEPISSFDFLEVVKLLVSLRSNRSK